MENNNKPGFILVLTLSIIALSVALVTYMVNNGRVFLPTARTMIEREKARMLARSGIEIAMSQLSLPDKGAEKKATNGAQGAQGVKDAKDVAAPSDDKKGTEETLFSFLIPHLNVWQKFKLARTVDGIQGEIGVCLMSEEGKLNLNELFDPSTGNLVESLKTNATAEKCIQDLFERIDKVAGSKDMRKAFETFLKNRKSKLDDVTELLMIKEFAFFKEHIFYDPPEQNAARDAKNIYLTDIFTVWSGKKTLQPWLLSDSLCGILNLSRAQDGKVEEKRKVAAEVQKAGAESLTFPDGWNKYLKLIYGKEFAALPKGIESLLDTKFEPKIFSVICYGKVGKTTQKVFAIVERVKAPTEKDKQQWNVTLKKLYWI